nr:T9SS type A sorting domain-containing protein [Cytophagales bacterium]
VLGGGMTAPYTASPTNVMIFRDNATAVGASDNSLVIGAVRKVGRVAGTFYFPIGTFVGSTPFYRPSGISSSLNVESSFISQYYLQNPTGAGFSNTALQASQVCSAMPLLNVSNREFWIVNRENLTDAVFVSLTWRNPQSGGVGNHTGLRVARWNGTLWQNVGGGSFDNYLGAAPGPASGAVGSAYNTLGCTGAVDNFSPFTLSSETEFNPLPATILDFAGRLENGGVQLTWRVNSEVNVLQYVVEHSPDGVNFTPIDTVAARGGNRLLTYQSFDSQPIDGANFYRLRIEDQDGSYEYSRVVTVRLGAHTPLAVTAYPNPSDGMHVYFRASGSFQLTDIFDLTGRRLAYRTASEGVDLRVEFAQTLPPGLYVAVLRTANGVERVKFVVKN